MQPVMVAEQARDGDAVCTRLHTSTAGWLAAAVHHKRPRVRVDVVLS